VRNSTPDLPLTRKVLVMIDPLKLSPMDYLIIGADLMAGKNTVSVYEIGHVKMGSTAYILRRAIIQGVTFDEYIENDEILVRRVE
jgi:hypothetical protein